MTCPARDAFGFCIPWQLGWPGCVDEDDRYGRPKRCKCPPDLETARQHRIRQIIKQRPSLPDGEQHGN